MTESSIRQWLIKLLKPYPIKLQPIESGSTGLGIPDLYFRATKQSGWIEFKIGKVNKNGEIKLRWEPGQLNWIKEHAELNGRTFLFVGVEPDFVLITQLNTVCIAFKGADNILFESTDYAGPMDLASAKHIMSMLNCA